MTVARTFSLSLSSLAMACAFPALAQAQREVVVPGGVMPAGTAPAPLSPSDTLAQNLRVLAANPRDVQALTQAGLSALAVGDPNAALGFLARAEQLSPSNGRVKAALGSVMVMMERPADAMPFFRQAQAYGVPEADYVADRALAFDLLGDTRQAQRDYALALRARRDPETVQRYALSLGISGNRDEALRLLEPLLRQQDQGAWRARAFVLAMTGDQRGAERIIQQVMPASMSGTMSSFLRKLPSLGASARAAAVNFGTMPSAGPVYATASIAEPMRAIPVSMTDSLTRDEQPQSALIADASETRRKSSKASRRRPGRDDQLAMATAPSRVTTGAYPDPSLDSRAAQTPRLAAIVEERKPRKRRKGEEEVPTPALARVYEESMAQRNGTVAPAAPVQTRASVPVLANRAPQTPMPPLGTPEPVFEISASPAPTRVAAVQPPRPIASPVFAAPVAPAPRAVPPMVVAPAPLVAAPSPAVATAPRLTVLAPAPAPTPAPLVVAPKPVDVVPVSAERPPVSAPAPVIARPQPVVLGAPVAPVLAPVVEPERVAVAPAPVPAPAPAPVAPPAEALIRPAFSEAVMASAPPAPEPVAPVAEALPPTPVVPPPPALAPSVTPALMGPPAPASEVLSSSVATPVVAAATFEPVATAPSEAVTQALPTAATPAPVEERGLESLLDDLTPEAERPAGAVLGDAEFRKARLAAKKKADAEAKADAAEEAEAKAKREEEDARKRELAKHPPRIWVQVATGSAKSGFGISLRRIREQSGDILTRYGSATVPVRATNRLLVGPFGSEGEARKTISALSKKGIFANLFTSAAGEEVTKLASK